MISKWDEHPFTDTDYDRKNNLLYIMVNPTYSKGIVKSKTHTKLDTNSNIAIYDLKEDKLIHFFDKNPNREILQFIYEKSYDKVNKKIEFNKSNHCIFNNLEIKERELLNKIFILSKDRVTEEFELWQSLKNGENKKLIKKFKKEIDWRIDVFNKKIIFIEKLENEVKIDSFNL